MPDIDWIRKFCLSLPEATEQLQWGETLCFKFRGKLFTVVDLSEGKRAPICFKCSVEKFHELLEIEGIAPAPYVGRYNWAMLAHSAVLPLSELRQLIQQSYELVVAKAPGKKRTATASGKRNRSR